MKTLALLTTLLVLISTLTWVHWAAIGYTVLLFLLITLIRNSHRDYDHDEYD